MSVLTTMRQLCKVSIDPSGVGVLLSFHVMLELALNVLDKVKASCEKPIFSSSRILKR